jgi:hypothetical protein
MIILALFGLCIVSCDNKPLEKYSKEYNDSCVFSQNNHIKDSTEKYWASEIGKARIKQLADSTANAEYHKQREGKLNKEILNGNSKLNYY